MGGRSTTTTTTVKGEEDEAWFEEQQQEWKSSSVNAFEPISIRVSKPAQQEVLNMFARQSSEVSVGGMGREVEVDDGGQSLCCFPSSRARYNRRKADSSFDGVEPGSTFSRLDMDLTTKGSLRSWSSRSLDALCCCCGPRRSGKWIVEVRGMEFKKAHGSDDRLRTAGRWELDLNDEYFKPPMWKQLVRKVKAQVRQVHGSRSDWLNYDPQSYEKNFDNGEFRQQFYARSLDENDDHGAREAALHTALLQRLASSRSQQDTNTSTSSLLPVASTAPVKLGKCKEDFVPIWQRRASTPINLDVRQQQSGDEE